MRLSLLAFLISSSVAINANPEHFQHFPDELCLATCEGTGSAEVCTFTLTINQGASELGYYAVDGCEGVMPILGMKKDVQYRFVQADLANYYHPLGFAYFADGAHDNVDELQPDICPSGSQTGCRATNTCPAPMYLLNDEYLGVYSNIPEISPLTGDVDFGLDVYEPQFFASPPDWSAAGTYEVALKFDSKYTKDIFYFCHIHQFMTGRIKFVDTSGTVLYPANEPAIPYAYEEASAYDQSCGTYGVTGFQLPNLQCPDKFVCDAPGDIEQFAGCIESMNCAMTTGMTTGASSDNEMALFVHQMIPHHQNAVNMAKALLANGILDSCNNIEEETPECILKVVCMEIITQQNHQIQSMYGAVEELNYSTTDDCVVPVSKTNTFNIVTSSDLGLGSVFCMDISTVFPKRNVVLKKCDGTLSQIWRIDHRGLIRNKKTNRCIINQGTKIQNKGCLSVSETDVSRGFDDTIVIGNRVITPNPQSMPPSGTMAGEIALILADRVIMNGRLVGPDNQEFTFNYIP